MYPLPKLDSSTWHKKSRFSIVKYAPSTDFGFNTQPKIDRPNRQYTGILHCKRHEKYPNDYVEKLCKVYSLRVLPNGKEEVNFSHHKSVKNLFLFMFISLDKNTVAEVSLQCIGILDLSPCIAFSCTSFTAGRRIH